jgi:hypothetical protein
MLVLDATSVNVALPSIQRALRMRASELTWVLTSYGLAFGGLLLIGGAVGLAILAAIATGTARNQPPGTALPDAFAHGYTTGILAGGTSWLSHRRPNSGLDCSNSSTRACRRPPPSSYMAVVARQRATMSRTSSLQSRSRSLAHAPSPTSGSCCVDPSPTSGRGVATLP